jgi:hypothetical protein
MSRYRGEEKKKKAVHKSAQESTRVVGNSSREREREREREAWGETKYGTKA